MYYPFLFLHAIPRRLQLSLTFSRHQMMYNLPHVVLSAEVTCKGYSNKVKNKIKH